jgi:glycosyltransferase involved in cell wall biosynthesis
MKILIIGPGAGDSFYCGNCFRDSLQASALIKAGNDVTILPLYLPMHHATEGVPIFFPAVSYYIEQAMFRKGNIPKWLSKFASSKMFLDLAASMSGSTSANGMENMTMSMITGDDGAFKRNLADMIEWVKKDGVPDIVHLSSSLLIGIAAPLKEELGIPVICSLQDEEVWIDSLKDKWSNIAWEAIIANSVGVDAFVTTSHYYKAIIDKKMPSLSPKVIYPGINIDKYYNDTLPDCPTIGFFYRTNEHDGLDTLAEAFVMLKKRATIPNLKLRIGGGCTDSDKKFLSRVKEILRPYIDDVIFEDDYSPALHHKFYSEVSLISVPLRFDESVGIYICEAYATSRPVVEPRRGSFPEIVGDAGVLYDDESATGLANALEQVLIDKKLYNDLRENAKTMAQERYSDRLCAEALMELYSNVITQATFHKQD